MEKAFEENALPNYYTALIDLRTAIITQIIKKGDKK